MPAAFQETYVLVAEHPSPVGDLWSCWTQHGLGRLSWTKLDAVEMFEVPKSVEDSARRFGNQLREYFHRGRQRFDEVPLDTSGWSDFHARVYRCCGEIAPTQTMTYKQLAAVAGNAAASRAVGAAMARNRIPIVIPCHRVISTAGNLRGFSAPGGLETKRQLLELERNGCWPAELFAARSCGDKT